MSDSQYKCESNTFFGRLKVETAELAERVKKLDAFIDTPAFYQLSTDDRTDLRIQLTYMQRYLTVLNRRVNRLSANH